jgi:hypothetical protein
MNKLSLVTAVVAGFLSFAIGPAAAVDAVSADDTARFLAGMPPSAGSPLVPLTKDANWQRHAAAMDKAFAEIEKRQLAKIRSWSGEHLTSPKPTMFYMFSGPDFLYANVFFPRATTYLMSGLEPSGPVPDLTQVKPQAIPSNLASLQNSMKTLLTVSYFITAEMSSSLQSSSLRGTLPVLYVFLARSGKKIREVSLVNLDGQGELMADTGPKAKTAARGAKIVFADFDGREQTLYYFSTDLGNAGVKKSGFLTFAAKLGDGDSVVKSASYLLHYGEFSAVRDFLLSKSVTWVQDDTGVPLKYFDAAKWELTPFGKYLTPIPVFEGVYQTKMQELFRKAQAKPIDFGVGYRWRPGESNLLLAVKRAPPERPAEKATEKKPVETTAEKPSDK